MNENILASFNIKEKLFHVNYLQSRFWVKAFDYDENMHHNYSKGKVVFDNSNSHVLIKY